MIRLAIDTPIKLVKGFKYTEGSFFWIMNNIFFQYYSLLIFMISLVVMVVVSYMTEAPSYAQISGLTYGTVTDEHTKESRSSWNARDVFASALVLVLIIMAYIYFSG